VDETFAAPASRPVQTSRPEVCPRCENGLLVTVETTHEVAVEGSLVRIPRVRADECRTCGYRSLSGREARLIEVLFASSDHRIADLVADLRAAGYHSMFLREDQTETGLGFGYEGSPELVFEVAKPRPYCRDHLLDLFVRHPGSQVSVSPNNIFVVESAGACECLLVDAGPAPFHDYSSFAFDECWNVTVPEKITRYREVGYIESDHDHPPANPAKGDSPQHR
jgi:YgiT-type zinc finger domain-containing protein